MEEFENNNVIQENVVVKTLQKSFLWMFLGLLATGIISFVTYKSNLLLQPEFYSMYPLILIIELVVVLLFNFLFKKLPPEVVAILYFVYAIISGLTLTCIYYLYPIDGILYAFFISAVYFGALAFLGYKTEKDLSKLGTLMSVALILCITVSIVNIFLGLSIVDTILDWIVLLIFAGITAYDVQRIKYFASDDEKAHIYCAMQLYLDFINIFLRILRLFAGRRRN